MQKPYFHSIFKRKQIIVVASKKEAGVDGGRVTHFVLGHHDFNIINVYYWLMVL